VDITTFAVCVLFLLVGIVLMVKNRFYKHKSNDILFPIELRMFLGGGILTLLGGYGVIVELIKLLR